MCDDMMDINKIFMDSYEYLTKNKEQFNDKDKKVIEDLEIVVKLLGLNKQS